MTTKTNDRNAELVAFFVANCLEELGRTRLMKLLYLADYESRRYLGRPISTLQYTWHHYGPYDAAVEKTIKKSVSEGVITEELVEYPNGRRGYLYEPGAKHFVPSFDPADLAILSFVCKKYSAVGLRELLDDIAYKTEPMEAAIKAGARNKPLNMAMVDNKKAKVFGVPFSALLQRSWAARAGDTIPHVDAMAAVDATLQNAA